MQPKHQLCFFCARTVVSLGESSQFLPQVSKLEMEHQSVQVSLQGLLEHLEILKNKLMSGSLSHTEMKRIFTNEGMKY
jgi:hypothetical protein